MNPTPPPVPTRPLLWTAGSLLLGGAATLPFFVWPAVGMIAGGAGLLACVAHHSSRRSELLQRQLVETEQDRARLAEELAEARGRCEQILHHASDAMFFVDPHDGTLLEVNRRAEEMLGYTCGDIRHLSLGVLFPGRYRRRFLKLVRKILKHGNGEDPELLFRRRDGTLLYGAVQARLGWLGEQRVVHGSIHDVTPNMHMINELRRHNRQLGLLNEIAQRGAKGQEITSLLDTILDQVIDTLAVDGGGIALLRSQGQEMQLAFHRGISTELAAGLDRLRPGEGLIGAVAASGRPRMSVDMQKDRRCAVPAAAADGWRAFLAVPLIAEQTCVGSLFVFVRGPRVLTQHELRLLQVVGQQVGPLVKNAQLFDELQWQQRINQAGMRELERSRAALRDNLLQLEQQNRALQDLEQMKSTFLALASHELRTPLTVICSGADLLQAREDLPLDEAGRRALEAIIHGSERLRNLVDDLLEAARLEANAIYLAREEFDPQTLLIRLRDQFLPLCAERNLSCELGAATASLTVRGDVHHLQRALARLLENAVKFTPEGGWVRLETAVHSGVEVEAMAERLRRFAPAFFSAPRAGRYLEIRIRDNGIGLDPGEDERIFDKFYAGGDIASHTSSRERFGAQGVGLGLTMARSLIAAHQGMLWAESEGLSRGSSFRLLLPIAEPAIELSGVAD